MSPPRLKAARKLAKTPAREGTDLEELEAEHRLGDLGLDDAEGDEQDDTEAESTRPRTGWSSPSCRRRRARSRR